MTPLRDTRNARPNVRILLAAISAAALLPWTASQVVAQPRVGTPAAAPKSAAVGLDSLNEETVMGELAGRGLNSLLNKMFDDRRVPPNERESFQSLQALRELKAAQSLTDDKRIELLRKSVEGLTSLMPKINDSMQLMEYAATLIAKGIEPDVNILDYWGENPIRQQRIKLPAKLAVDMLNKASGDAIKQMEALQATIKSANDPRVAKCEELYNVSNQAKFVANTSVYYHAIAIDGTTKAGLDERKKLVDPVLKYLEDFANNDSGAAPMVMLRMGRLCMAKGDYVTAKKHLQTVIDKQLMVEKKAAPMTPAPTDWQQNEARYFSIVCDVLAKKLTDADKGQAALENWLKSADTALRDNKGIAAQMRMLAYRVLQAKADLATGPEKGKISNQADAELDKLAAINPGFNALVAEQRVSRVKDDTDLKTLSVPILSVLMSRGVAEWRKADGDATFDAKVLDRGLESAKVIMSKKVGGDNGPSASAVESATRNAALFLERQNKLVEAANVYLQYAETPAYQGKETALRSMDRAVYLATQAYVKDQNNAEAIAVYERMLATGAAPPYNIASLFFFRADRLRAKAMNYPEAMKFYAKVPSTDKRYYDSRYWMMVLGEQELDKVKDPANLNRQVREVADWAAQVRPLAQAAISGSKDATAQSGAKFRLQHSTLTEAKLLLRQLPPQPKKAVALLENFESGCTGLKSAEALIAQAVFVRAKALMAEARIKDAIVEVEKLNANPKTENYSTDLVQQLLETVQNDIKAARDRNDKDALAKLLDIRATLSGMLMPFAKKQADPKKREELVANITRFDANAKFEAGQALPVGSPDREKRLKEAMAVYLNLLQTNKDDVRSTINVGKCQYELGQYSEAITTFATLVQRQKIGVPTIQEMDLAGNMKEKDNVDYWEVNYDLNNARYLLANKNPNDPESVKMLDAARRSVSPLFSIHGERTGGEQFRKQFVELREKLMPGGVVPGATTQPAATQPAASAR